MRGRLVGLALACAAGLQGAYTYDVNVTGYAVTQLGQNGSYSSGSLYTGGDPEVIYWATFPGSGGSGVWNVGFASPNDYEVKSTLYLNSGGGTYIHFLRANSTSVQAGSGSYISAEIVMPSTFSAYAAAALNINQCTNGVVTQLASTSITAFSGMTFRTVIFGTDLWVYDGANQLVAALSVPLTTGVPGIGGYGQPSNSGFSSLAIGHHDTAAPNQISANTVATSLTATSTSLKWGQVSDDPTGTGVYGTFVTRSGQQTVFVASLSYTDPTVQPSTTYQYNIQAVDYHGNAGSPTTVTITTPPAQSIDPRRVGISKLGSYWGGGGEQIDTLSGNLNFSLPLLTAQGRAGWSVPLSLSYNSQNWRNDNNVNWQMSGDVGFGYGWTMQIGSITPYYANWFDGPDHFVYTDGTGAQYVLNQNSGGVWASQQSAYVWYDANEQILHFKDGTFWLMGCTSAGAEADAGTLYPTIIEDTGGNQVIVTYDTGLGLPFSGIYYDLVTTTPNTSARIVAIEDVRAGTCNNCGGIGVSRVTYLFDYGRIANHYVPTADGVPHLVSVTNNIGTPETYTFTYQNATVEPRLARTRALER